LLVLVIVHSKRICQRPMSHAGSICPEKSAALRLYWTGSSLLAAETLIYRSEALSHLLALLRGKGAVLAGSIHCPFSGRWDYAAFWGKSSQEHCVAYWMRQSAAKIRGESWRSR
jgi:hypothetical protein